MTRIQSWKWILMGALVLAAMLMGFLSSNTSNVAMALDKPTPQPTPIIKKGGGDSSVVSPMANENYYSQLAISSYNYGQDKDTFWSASSATGVNSLQVWSYLYINGQLKKQTWKSCYCGSISAQSYLIIDKALNHNKDVEGTHLFDYGGGNSVWRYSHYIAY